MVLLPLKDAPGKLKKWTEPLLTEVMAGQAEGGPSMLAFGPVGSLGMMQHLEGNKKKMVGKCLSDRSMYKIYVLLYVSVGFFFLIRTQAFGVFSEVSSQ